MKNSASKSSVVFFLIYFNTVMIRGPKSSYVGVTVKIGQNNTLKVNLTLFHQNYVLVT